jgi:hypothetical protein
VQVGNGQHVSFWLDNWIDGSSIRFLAPNLSDAVPARVKKKKNVGCARADGRCAWVRAITGALTMQTIIEYQLIWASLENFCLNSEDFFFRKRA